MLANETPASFEQIHRALLAGLLGNIGFKNEEGEYLGARAIKFAIFPGSVLRKAQPKWVMAAELTETTRLYARCVAKIDPEWIEPVAQALVKKHYFDPHWEKERAMVVAFERVTLYGLTIVAKRRVHYGPIDPKEAREIFIRRALAAGDYLTRSTFYEHNQRLIKEVQELEHKARRRDVLVDEQVIFEFYDALIPPGIHNGAAFEKWRREAEAQGPEAAVPDARLPDAARGLRYHGSAVPGNARRGRHRTCAQVPFRSRPRARRRDGDRAAASAEPARGGGLRLAGAGTDPRQGCVRVQGAAENDPQKPGAGAGTGDRHS